MFDMCYLQVSTVYRFKMCDLFTFITKKTE